MFFKKRKHRIFRRIAWIFFFVIFTGLWITRGFNPDNAYYLGSGAKWIYPITAVLSLAMLLFDGTIQRIRTKMDLDKGKAKINEGIILEKQNQIAKIGLAIQSGFENVSTGNRKINKLMDEIARLESGK